MHIHHHHFKLYDSDQSLHYARYLTKLLFIWLYEKKIMFIYMSLFRFCEIVEISNLSLESYV